MLVKSIFFTLLFASALLSARAQYAAVWDESIRSLRIEVEGDEGRLPVVELGSDEQLRISFDRLSHDYHRYSYSLHHCTWDWKPSTALFETDFVEAERDETLIEDHELSQNTTQLYTHYWFTFPNERVTPLLSGNYILLIRDDDEETGTLKDVAQVCFMVVEQEAGISYSLSANTDVDRNAAHQQLTMEVSHGRLHPSDPLREMRVVVLQNRQWSTARMNPAPTSVRPSSLAWEHARDLIFPAGAEYRKFEISNTRFGGLGVDRVRYFEPYYHITLYPDNPRRSYLYDEDEAGRFVPISNNSGGDPETEAEYVFVHFALSMDYEWNGRVWLDGLWTHELRSSVYEMQYNAQSRCYEAALFLKQGYYSYRYVLGAEGQTAVPAAIEGNFWQTENTYTILVYFSALSGRYDRLVGFREFYFRPQ